MTEGPEGLAEQNAALRARVAHLDRQVRQLERVARRSENLATQSKRSMARVNKELEATIEKLRATTVHLSDAKSAAEQASEAKSRFLATMSHEIRTPMNGVIGSLELLMCSGLNSEQGELADVMHSSARTLLQLINDILDFARVEAGRLELERLPFRLADCVEEVLAQEMPNGRKKDLLLALDLDEDVPLHVLGDSMRLRQVLSNLVSNAVKFTELGEVRVGVTLVAEERVCFTVRDTGIGIDADAQARIFDVFTQADGGTTRTYGGSGLGLAISVKLVELMGGTLTVESVPGEGSTFTFDCLLPPAEVAALDKAKGGDAPIPAQFGRHVLVVDDVATNRMLTSRMLRKLGCTTEQAENGRDAVECVQAGTFDLVLMDCSMPIMDGYDASRAIRELLSPAAAVPIIALTAYAMAGDRERCLTAGMNDYLTKPVRLGELEKLLGRLLPKQAA